MYDFIYYVLYKANIKDGTFTARFQATLITFFAAFVHVAFAFAVLRRIFLRQFKESGVANWFNNNKSMYLLMMAILFVSVFTYYDSERIKKVLTKYETKNVSSKTANALKVILILLVPIILGAILLVWKMYYIM